MAKQTLDLYELFRLVVSKGGLVEVINKKLWREITKGLNLPSSITSAAFTLRTQSAHLLMILRSAASVAMSLSVCLSVRSHISETNQSINQSIYLTNCAEHTCK